MKNGQSKKQGAKKVLKFLIYFTISFVVYRLIIELGARVNVMIYYIGITSYAVAIAVLFCVFYAKNGYTFSNVPPQDICLPDNMTSDEQNEYLLRYEKSRQSAKKLLLVITPMVLTVLINYAGLVLEDFFASFFN